MSRDQKRSVTALILALVMSGVSSAAIAQSVTRENFREYLDALENVDAEALTTRFYHEELTVDIGDETLDLAGLLEYERSLKSLVDFHFEVEQIVADESGIAIDAVETFVVLQDAEVPVIGPARKGERWELHLNIFYGLRDGRISNIKANVLSAQKVE